MAMDTVDEVCDVCVENPNATFPLLIMLVSFWVISVESKDDRLVMPGKAKEAAPIDPVPCIIASPFISTDVPATVESDVMVTDKS